MNDVYRTKLNSEGRLVIPLECRNRAGILPGQEVLLTITDYGLKVTTPERALRQFQAEIRSLVGSGTSLVDELLNERRRETDRENHE